VIPYNRLHIYQIDGKIPHRDNGFPPEYIGTWQEEDDAFIFFSEESEAFVQALLKRSPSLHLIERFVLDYLEWQAGEEIRPFRVGRLVFIPAWEETSPSANEIPIWIDPSVVFGTGLHPTTRSCLEALWKLFQNGCPPKVIDLGTGTGILALACSKLGAQEILAVDHNPLAVKTAIRNVMLNREGRRIHVIRGRVEKLIRERADLLCCNLHYGLLDRLLGSEAFFQKRWTILSGFFKRETERIIPRLKARGVMVDVLPCDGPWQTIVGSHPAS
jgi:ribosomal protein L11 methyltransferase